MPDVHLATSRWPAPRLPLAAYVHQPGPQLLKKTEDLDRSRGPMRPGSPKLRRPADFAMLTDR